MNLVDVEARNREKPKTFLIPPRELRADLRPGMFAKLIFDDRERMWVRVASRDEAGVYVGLLCNTPVVVEGIAYGDPVKFGPEHVADVADFWANDAPGIH